MVRASLPFRRTDSKRCGHSGKNRTVPVLVLAVLLAIGADVARAEAPIDAARMTTLSCDPQADPQLSPDVYVPAVRASETPLGATRYRPPGDWPWLCRYRADNQAALAFAAPNVVFYGDSITENWAKIDVAFFSRSAINRGISGQTSAQLLLRFYQDVIALRPRKVHIIVGTNDVAGNSGALDAQSYKNNILAMVDLARTHRIQVILGSIPPAARFPWRSDVPALVSFEPVREIRELNLWLQRLAKERNLIFVNYHDVMANADGAMQSALTRDGVHPNAKGYEVMRRLAAAAVAKPWK